MSGYFSRLVKRTGLTFKGKQLSRVTGQISRVADGREDVSPLHKEVIRVTDSKPANIKEQPLTINKEIHSDTTSQEINDEHPIQYESADQKLASEQYIPKEQQSGFEAKTGEDQNSSTDEKSTLPDQDSHVEESNKGQVSFGREITEDGIISSEDVTVSLGNDENDTRDKELTSDTSGLKDEIPSQEQLIKEVRKWVSQSPEADHILPDTGVSLIVADDSLVKTKPAGSDNIIVDNIDRSSESGSGIQDLHLSIGSINITVEEPADAVQVKQPVRSSPAGIVKQTESISRLRRHYLRI